MLQTTLTVLRLSLNQLTKLVYIIFQIPHTPGYFLNCYSFLAPGSRTVSRIALQRFCLAKTICQKTIQKKGAFSPSYKSQWARIIHLSASLKQKKASAAAAGRNLNPYWIHDPVVSTHQQIMAISELISRCPEQDLLILLYSPYGAWSNYFCAFWYAYQLPPAGVRNFSLCQDKAEHTANCLAFGMDGLTIVYVQLSLVSWLFLSNFLCISIAQSVALLCLFGQFPSLSHHKTEKKKKKCQDPKWSFLN